MIDGRRNRKDFASIVQETFKEFAENTSIHGLKYTVKREVTIYEKVFWIIVVLAGLSGAGYMTVLFWNRYTSNPTRTSILTAYAPNTAVPFPAVTLCNINRIMKDQVDEFVEELTVQEDEVEIVRRAFPQLLALTSVPTRNYNMTELMILHDVLLENNYNEIGAVMKKIMQPCEDMILKCMWQFKTVPCREIFEETLTTEGPCCSFNYIREYIDGSRRPLYTPFNGFNSGLKLHLDPDIQTVQYSSLHSSGLKVLVHSPWDYPGSGSIYKIVSAGRQSYLQVSASRIVCSSDIKRLSIEQRQCVYSEEVRLKYFQLYSDTNCLTECEETYLYARCGCVPFYYPFSTRRVCNITNIPCLDESIGGSIEIRAKFETSCSRHDPGQHHQSLQLPVPVRGHVLQRDVLHGHLGQQRSRPHLLVLGGPERDRRQYRPLRLLRRSETDNPVQGHHNVDYLPVVVIRGRLQFVLRLQLHHSRRNRILLHFQTDRESEIGRKNRQGRDQTEKRGPKAKPKTLVVRRKYISELNNQRRLYCK
ncbi:sodium channel protein Nach-like isoform X1 [Tenebrio molitor]|uniref:sodium channel protein Nach-like isoform X1 n=1 Tax=Tenebrio molitor TaxID=7067 RepID=UPI0036246B56